MQRTPRWKIKLVQVEWLARYKRHQICSDWGYQNYPCIRNIVNVGVKEKLEEMLKYWTFSGWRIRFVTTKLQCPWSRWNYPERSGVRESTLSRARRESCPSEYNHSYFAMQNPEMRMQSGGSHPARLLTRMVELRVHRMKLSAPMRH